MILRKCRRCGCAMDPGEGVNGMCEENVRGLCQTVESTEDQSRTA